MSTDDDRREILANGDAAEVAPARPAARRRRVAVASVAAAGLALGATGVAVAADSPAPRASDAPSPSPSVSGDPGSGSSESEKPADSSHRDLFGPGRHGGPIALEGFGALHGEYVTTGSDGGYRTVRVQRGEVTAVSSSSITLESEDGYAGTYAVTGETLVNAGRGGITDLEVGSDASVAAVVEGAVAEAVRVTDLEAVAELRERFRGPRHLRPGSPRDEDSGTSRSSRWPGAETPRTTA